MKKPVCILFLPVLTLLFSLPALAAGEGIRAEVQAGDTVILENIPAGYTYEICEEDLPAGWTARENSFTGAVPAGGDAAVTARNDYAAAGTAAVAARVSLAGRPIRDGEFSFTLGETGAVNGPADTRAGILDPDAGTQSPNPWYGTAEIFFPPLSFKEEGVYTFTLRQVPGDDEEILYDTHEETVTVTVTDQGDGTLRTEVPGTFLFENRLKTSSLRLQLESRNSTAAAAAARFEVTFSFRDPEGNPLEGAYEAVFPDGTVTQLRTGDALRLSPDASLSVNGLPAGTSYTLTERLPPGWEKTEENNTCGTIPLSGADAQIRNTYGSRGSVRITAEKVFPGPASGFTFRILDREGREITRAAADAAGLVSFPSLSFTEQDDGKTFAWTVEEIPGEDSMILWDTHSEAVAVSVTDLGDGTLRAEASYDEDGAVFRNTPCGTLTITRRVTGNAGNRAEEALYEIVFPDRTETVSLRDGESAVYEGLRRDTPFTIRQRDAQGWTIAYEAPALALEGEGDTIQGTLTDSAEIVIENRREAAVPTGIRLPMHAALPLFAAIPGYFFLRAARKKEPRKHRGTDVL